MKDFQESRWIDRAKRGDADAFEELVRRYQRRVLALTCRLCANPEDGAEAAQEAFLAAWQGLPSFRGDAAFSTWLYRLASNACVDLLRREGRRRAAAGPSLDDEEAGMDLPSTEPTPEAAAEGMELREMVEAGLQRLPAEYREALILREIHQLSYEEIAAALTVELGTVKSRINRGRRQLRAYLQKTGNFFPAAPSNQTKGKGGR